MGSAIFQAPEPLDQFFKKICTVDYVGDPTPPANIWVSWTANRRAAGLSLSE